MRTELESGAWVEHTPLQDLRAKDKDAVGQAVYPHLPAAVDGAELPALDAAGRARMAIVWRNTTWARVLTAWSYEDLPLPRLDRERALIENEDSIGELPLDDFDELSVLFAPFVAKIMRAPDPKGRPTATTSTSNGSSRARSARSPKG